MKGSLEIGRYRTDPASFIDDFIRLNEKRQPWPPKPYQRRVLKRLLRWTKDGRLDCVRMLLWGEMKKSGKTALAAALGLWWAYTRPLTEVIVVANDLEQSVGRVFKTMTALIAHNPALQRSATVRATSITLTNGTVVTAIASDYRGAAGSRHSLVIVDEPWGFTSESAERLMEELTPPPTEPEAWVLMVTYAGFIGESTMLERVYQRGLQGERLDDELELYRNQELVMFWSQTPRQPWQTPEYYAEQRRALRPNAYARLHENQWVTSESTFITPEMWDPCVLPDLHASLASSQQDVPTSVRSDPAYIEWQRQLTSAHRPLFVGVDASTKHDSTAVVAVQWSEKRDTLQLVMHRIWRPSREEPIDLERTVEAYLLRLRERFDVAAIYADPFQMHRSITALKKQGVPIEEFPQTVPNTTRMGQQLFEVLSGRTLQMYPAADLREQALSTVAVESPRGWRIAKERVNKKIDAIVALAMACVAAVEGLPGRGFRMIPLKGFTSRAHHAQPMPKVARLFFQSMHRPLVLQPRTEE